jgi:hypothetical protein
MRRVLSLLLESLLAFLLALAMVAFGLLLEIGGRLSRGSDEGS